MKEPDEGASSSITSPRHCPHVEGIRARRGAGRGEREAEEAGGGGVEGDEAGREGAEDVALRGGDHHHEVGRGGDAAVQLLDALARDAVRAGAERRGRGGRVCCASTPGLGGGGRGA